MLSILKLNKPNITNFAEERNELLKKAKTDWVLFLDNDETIDSINLSLRGAGSDVAIKNNRLLHFVRNDSDYDCYYLKRKNYFLGQYVGTDRMIRLVKKGTGKFVRKVHEVWKPNSLEAVGYSDEVITHNTADNLSDYLKKMNKYSDLHAKANLEEGKKSNLLKIIFLPIAKFFVTYLKSKNVVFSIMQTLHSYLAWTKMYLYPVKN